MEIRITSDFPISNMGNRLIDIKDGRIRFCRVNAARTQVRDCQVAHLQLLGVMNLLRCELSWNMSNPSIKDTDLASPFRQKCEHCRKNGRQNSVLLHCEQLTRTASIIFFPISYPKKSFSGEEEEKEMPHCEQFGYNSVTIRLHCR